MLPPSSLSVEGQITTILAKLDCKLHHFADISRIVSRSRVKTALENSQKSFKRRDAEHLLEIAQHMAELQSSIDVAIDWAKTERVRTALAVRLAMHIEHESGSHILDSAAQFATQSVAAESETAGAA